MKYCKFTPEIIYDSNEKGLITVHNPFNVTGNLGEKMFLRRQLQ